MSTATKTIITLFLIIIAAGIIFCIVGLIMAGMHGIGFAEEITSWFTKAVEDAQETEEVVETALYSITSFLKLG